MNTMETSDEPLHRLMEKAKSPIFHGRLSFLQLNGVGLILDEAAERQIPLDWTAYILATITFETNGDMQPGRDQSSILKLRKRPDWPYYRRGLIPIQGANNYAKLGCLEFPDQMQQWEVALPAAFDAMIMGTLTGAKLGDYFSPGNRDAVGARRIITSDMHDAMDVAALYVTWWNILWDQEKKHGS